LREDFDRLGISYSLYLGKILKEEFGEDIDEADIRYEKEIVDRPFVRLRPFERSYAGIYDFDPVIGEGANLAGFVRVRENPEDDRYYLQHSVDGEGLP
jgi:hypothetical protein